MTRRRRAALLVLAAGLLLSPRAQAAADSVAPGPVVPPSPQPERLLVRLTAGNQPGFGRLVIDLPPPSVAAVTTSPAGLTVRITAARKHVWFGQIAPPPRNVASVHLVQGALSIPTGAGVVIRQTRLPGRLVLDFLDRDASAPAGALWPLQRPPPMVPAPPPDHAAPAEQGQAPMAAVPGPVEADALPPPGDAAVSTAPKIAEVQAGPVVLPVPARAGVAAFRRGAVGLLVADADRPADPQAWRALPGLADAMVTSLPGATLVSFRLPGGEAVPGTVPVLGHGPQGWTLDLSGGAPPDQGIGLTVDPPRLLLGVTGASRVVAVADPLGGGVLLVGTVLPNAAPAMVGSERGLPCLTLLPTWRGVVVEPLSDLLDMRPVATGFMLDPGPQRAMLGKLVEGGTAAAPFSRRFDLPPLPVAALVNREEAASGAVSAAPPRGRGIAQVRLAEAMVALGLGAEAQAVLSLALAADGRLATDPQALALGGVAALLAGRLSESGGLDDDGVSNDPVGVDEVALWRALRAVFLAVASGDAVPADAARTIAARQAILLSYPEPLRRRLLPLAAETLAEGGEPRAAERLIAAAGPAPGLDYAKALLDLRAGRIDPALGRLDGLASQTDRSERARAAVRAVELRLATGHVTVPQAADALDRLIAAWRGDGRELAVRLRVAELRAQAGQFRPALALLRETSDLGKAGAWSAAQLDGVRARMATVFAETLAHDDATPMAPLEFVSLIEDNADLLPSGPEGERVASRVADRLAALDLPDRAAAALRRLVDAAPPGATRAALGARLAAMQLQEGDPQAALITLSTSTAEALAPPLVAERTMIFARATALRGDVDAATGALAALDTPASEALRTELLEKAGRWPEATAALSRRVVHDVPADGVIPKDAASLVLRLASAAAQAGQNGILNQIRTDYLPRMGPGESTDMLRVLTEGPVRGVSDLPRAAQEAALARSATR